MENWREIMKESKDEYLMLRDEILHLDTIANNTINFSMLLYLHILHLH